MRAALLLSVMSIICGVAALFWHACRLPQRETADRCRGIGNVFGLCRHTASCGSGLASIFGKVSVRAAQLTR